MASIINADTSNGLKLTSDTSGIISFQSAGVTKAGINSTGLTGDGSQLTGISSGGMTLFATINTTSGTSHSTGTIDLTGYKTIFIFGDSVGNSGAAGRLRITPNGGTAQTIYSNPSGNATKAMYGLYIQDLATGALLSNFKVDEDRSQSQVSPRTYNGVNGGINKDLSASTTSIVFDWDGGETFDVGQIKVYAIK